MRAQKLTFDSKTDTSVIELIERGIKTHWTLDAYTDYGTDINYKYSDVARHIYQIHDLFRRQGIKPGDKVALCSKNCSNWAVSFLSIFTYGAVAVPILSDFNAEQIQNIYEHSESVLLMCTANYVKMVPSARCMDIQNWSLCDGTDAIDTNAYADIKVEDVKFFRENPDDLSLISYTSGSTGRSKGVMLPYRSVWSNVIFADEVLDFNAGDKTLAILPMAHMYGFAFDFMFEFTLGIHVHFFTKTPSPSLLLKAFADIKPVVIIVVPLVLEKIITGKVFPVLRTPTVRALTSIPGLRNIVYRKIRNQIIQSLGGNFYECIIGGAAFSKEVEDFLKLIHFPYTVGYGMTECGPIIGYEDWHEFAKGSCGKAAPRMEVKILSNDPVNQAGEIVTRGTNVMLGYYKNPEETAEAIDQDGWLHTGDLGTMDEKGNIFIRGRKKTMLLGANGQNVYPEEIEDVITSHTIFEETVVVQRGEKLVALVYISDKALEHHGLNRESLMQNLPTYKRTINSYLPNFSKISDIEIRDEEFEKTPKRNIRRFLYK